MKTHLTIKKDKHCTLRINNKIITHCKSQKEKKKRRISKKQNDKFSNYELITNYTCN